MSWKVLPVNNCQTASLFEANKVLMVLYRGSIFYLEMDRISEAAIFKKLPLKDEYNKELNVYVRQANVDDKRLWIDCRSVNPQESLQNDFYSGELSIDGGVHCTFIAGGSIHLHVTDILPYNESQVFHWNHRRPLPLSSSKTRLLFL